MQTCIVHLIRASLRYVTYRDRKKVASALRPIYTAANAEDALTELERFDKTWGAAYPMITDAWRRDWPCIIPFLALPDGLRKAVYTTNTIEGLHRQIRKAIKTRGHFPDQQAATKLIYPRHHPFRGPLAEEPHLDNSTRRPQDPLRRPIPRLTPTISPGLTHRRSNSLGLDVVPRADHPS